MSSYRALQTSSNQGYAGTVLLFHPIEDKQKFENGDKRFRALCCEEGGSNNDCELFFQRRIVNTGFGYVSPKVGKYIYSYMYYNYSVNMYAIITATGRGDPHYKTFDGHCYTFNGFGEFILMEALSENDTPVFTLQGRTGMVSFWPVTTHLALAFGTSLLAFHVSH